MTLIRAKADGPRTLGVDPKTGMNVYAINGRFGAYVQLGEMPEKGSKEKPKRSSLIGSMTESTITLEEALKLLELPRELGAHPESATVDRRRPRTVRSVHQARRRLPIARSDRRSVYRRSRARARAARRAEALRRARRAKRVIRKIEVPDGGTALQVLEGRFGPYVTDGETNASIPKGADPATLSLEDAQALLEARRGAPPREPRRGRRGAAPTARGRGRRAAERPTAAAAKAAPAAKAKAKAKPTRKPRAGKAPSANARADAHPNRRRRPRRLRGRVAGRIARRAGDAVRDAAGPRHRRPQDRSARRAGLQQLLPRRQTRQRGRPAERRNAPARLAGHARGGGEPCPRRRGARGRPRAFRRRGHPDADRPSSDHDRARRDCGDPGVDRARTGDRRHRTVDLRRPLRRPRPHRRRRASVLLRRDQPDRPRRHDRSLEGVPAVAVGSELQGNGGARCGGAGLRRAGWTMARAII